MSSVPLGLGYMFWQRSRWFVYATLGYFALATTIILMVPAGSATRDDGILLTLPLFISAVFLMLVFGYSGGDLGSRESNFPRHMFTLPATTHQLAAWPMLIGASAFALLWTLAACVILIPEGWSPPILWPALLFASLLAWTQAVTIHPFKLRYVRAVLVILCGTAVVAFGLIANSYAVRPAYISLTYLASILPAYALATRGLALARRGDGTTWNWRFAAAPAARRSIIPTAHPYRDGFTAQCAFEFRRNVWAFLGFTALMLAALWGCALLSLAAYEDRFVMLGNQLVPVNTLLTGVVAALAMPPLVATFMAGALAKADAWQSRLTLPLYLATKPLGTVDLVRAKMRAACLAAAAAWIAVLISIACWCALFWLDGRLGRFGQLFSGDDAWRNVGRAALLLLLLIALTWRQMVVGFYAAMTGRPWFANGLTIAFLLLFLSAPGIAGMLYKYGKLLPLYHWLRENVPWLLATLITFKALLAAWAMTHLLTLNLARPGQVVRWMLIWTTAVATTTLALALLLPGDPPLRHLTAFAVLSIPLARLAAAPLALRLNRHR